MVYKHIEIENNYGGTIQDTGYGFGYQFGAGLDYPFTIHLSLRPQVGYRALSRDFENLNINAETALNYIVLALGVSKTF